MGIFSSRSAASVFEGHDIVARQTPLHRSIRCDRRACIEFTNKTEFNVNIFWLGYQGEWRLYKSVKPGATYRQPTYLTHPWEIQADMGRKHFKIINPSTFPRVVCAETGQAITYPLATPVTQVEIVPLAPLQWSPSLNHLKSYTSFRSAVRTLITCHLILQKRSAAAMQPQLTPVNFGALPKVGLHLKLFPCYLSK